MTNQHEKINLYHLDLITHLQREASQCFFGFYVGRCVGGLFELNKCVKHGW